jgi:hypothetical protein
LLYKKLGKMYTREKLFFATASKVYEKFKSFYHTRFIFNRMKKN